MSLKESKIFLQAMQNLLDAVNAHCADLDEKEVAPDGHSYNELNHLVTTGLTAILTAHENVKHPQETVAASVRSARSCTQRLIAAKKLGNFSAVELHRNVRNGWMVKARDLANDISFIRMRQDSAPASTQVSADNELVPKALKAFLDRISLASFRSLMEASERCTQEQLNGNANSQLNADRAMEEAVFRAVSQMVSSDRLYLMTLLAP